MRTDRADAVLMIADLHDLQDIVNSDHRLLSKGVRELLLRLASVAEKLAYDYIAMLEEVDKQ